MGRLSICNGHAIETVPLHIHLHFHENNQNTNIINHQMKSKTIDKKYSNENEMIIHRNYLSKEKVNIVI